MDITKKQYDKMVKKASPPSKVIRDVIFAFLIGGAICTVGQIVNMCYGFYIQNQDDVSALTSMTMIFLGALLTGLNVYDDIAKYGGAGTLVPITGFANSIVSPAMEFRTEGYVLGVGANMFKIAGPVLVFGISTSVIYGVIYFFMR
ncbi:MAG: stage V sporulation protein AC [Clostridia bacterium]|nr:stage V sporulation protein AC [Clostridia bacterium]